MTCFFSLPAVLSGFSERLPGGDHQGKHHRPRRVGSPDLHPAGAVPALMVGQNLQIEAADARAAKTFEDVEDARNSIKQALTLLDIHTEGGLKTLLDAIEALKTTP
jgi:hypothetical protein